MKTFNPSPKQAAIMLHTLNGIISANIFIYITALFLGSYPISWIPYFFIGRTIFEVCTSFLIAPFLSKNAMRAAIVLEIGSAVFIGIMIISFSKAWFLFPLIFSFVLTIAGLISNAAIWNSTRNAFDIIELKHLSPLLSLGAAVGKILFSLGNIWLIKQFGIAYLPYCVAVAILLSVFYIFALTPLPTIISTVKPLRAPIRYSLFRNLFLFSFILAFCYTLVDYTLRNKLASLYNSQQIGLFISIFTAVTYFLSVVFTTLFSKQLIRLGVTSLLQVLPIYWIFLPIGVIFSPSMTMVAMMGSGDYVFFNFIKIGWALLLNVLPNQIRTIGEVSIQTVAESIGIGIASLFLILIVHFITLPRIAVCILFCSLVLILFARRLKKNYVTTLKSEILLKRFSIEKSDINPYQKTIEENVNQFLISPDPNSIRFGYALLASIKVSKFPTPILNHLFSLYSDIRIEAIKGIIYLKAVAATQLLLALLESEHEAEVKWWILNALAETVPKPGDI